MTDSDDLKELRERALASETNANELFEISAQHPEVYAEVAANPNAYPDLLDWLENVGDDRVKAVVAARRDGLAGTEALAKGSQEAAEAASDEKDSDPECDQAEQEPGSADSSTLAFAPPTDRESETEATEQIETTDQAAETERAEEAAAAAEGAAAETEELAESPVASAAAETAGESPEPPSESAQSPQIPGSDEENDDDATRLGSLPVANRASSAQTVADYPTVMAAPAAMPPAYASPVYAEPAYPEPPRQPIMSPSPAAYSPFPAYQNPAGKSSQPEKSGRSWGIIILTVLLVVALIGLAIVGTWIVSSRGDNKGQASASESQSDATRTATVMETTVTTTETPVETGKPIPAGAVYLERGFYTPTGNIGCLMFSDEVYCQIYQRQWEQGCDDIWAMQLTAGGVDQHCDPGNGTDPQTQATYDTVYYNGDYACEVGKYTGVNCWNSKTGRGFTMRQADHSTY